MKREWTKDRHFYVIEIRVGNVWTEAERYQGGESVAIEKAQVYHNDPSVKETRVKYHEISHSCYHILQEEVETAGPIPKKWIKTNRTMPCLVCASSSDVAIDPQGTSWCVCGSCKRTLPLG